MFCADELSAVIKYLPDTGRYILELQKKKTFKDSMNLYKNKTKQKHNKHNATFYLDKIKVGRHGSYLRKRQQSLRKAYAEISVIATKQDGLILEI